MPEMPHTFRRIERSNERPNASRQPVNCALRSFAQQCLQGSWDEAPHYLIRDRDAVYGSVVTACAPWAFATSRSRPQPSSPILPSLTFGIPDEVSATRTLLKAWSSGGVAASDLVMLDVAMELYDGADAQRGFANTADAFNKDIEPPPLVFEGK
jgi:hypothetical protein